MPEWPSVSFENGFLRELALELRKRAKAIQALVSDYSAKRVDEIEEFGGAGGGVDHQGLELRFVLWGNPAPRVYIKIYDDYTFILRIHDPYVSMDGRIADCNGCAVAGLIEETLRAVPMGSEALQKLWNFES